MLNRSEEAIDALREALTLRPDDVRLLGDLGETLRFMEREEEAVSVLDRALAQQPDSAFCLATRGYALRMLERYADGARDLRRAVEIDPAYAWAHGALGHLLVEITEAPDAARHAARAFELDLSLVWCRGVEGFAKLLLGDLAGARDVTLDAHERDPLELNWTQHLADILLGLGDRAGAEPLYREVVERGSSATDPDTLARVAWAHRNLGEHDGAARTYQRAMTLPGRRLEYMRFDFALALVCGGRVALGIAEYGRALQAIFGVDPLRAHGLLVVARRDFELARRASQLSDEAAAPVRRLLDEALERNALETGGADALSSPASQQLAGAT
jgi:tetratricopeptide (TPR) repeat protein